MKDRFFYPLMSALIAGGIYYALSFGGSEIAPSSAEIKRDGFVLSEGNLAYMTASPGTSYRFIPNSGVADGSPYVTIGAHTAKENAQPSAGVFINLEPEYAEAFSDKLLEITIRARQSAINPATNFEAGYFIIDQASSGWKGFALGPSFEDHVFFYTLEARSEAVSGTSKDRKWWTFGLGKGDAVQARHLIGIWPDTNGSTRALDIDRISIKIKN